MDYVKRFDSGTRSDYTTISASLKCDRYFMPESSTREVLDITNAPRRLTSLSIALARCISAWISLTETVTFVTALVEKYGKVGPGNIIDEMRDRLILMRHQSEVARLEKEAEKEAAQAMVQMVSCVDAFDLLHQFSNFLTALRCMPSFNSGTMRSTTVMALI